MPSNQYPHGKISPDDEGALHVGMRIEGDTIVLDFGKLVSWVGLDKDSAITFADSIRDAANQI